MKNAVEIKYLEKSVEEVMHESMMPYSEHVILDRALPRVEDGLKPVQRRIFYTMLELGLEPDKPYRKSARIVGDCLGKYHPHGDKSVYDAMVRMAQPFNMRMTLVDGHGNYGSVDGDNAAAMRYTEARLEPLAMELLKDLEKDTVKWNLNFDDTLKEPETLPGRFPNLLVNGASGIAVGLATNIPTHNLAEVIDGAAALIDNPRMSLDGMMKYIKGPDFPTGGYLCGGEELVNAYETGRGKITLRAKFHIEELNDKKSIVITELPYQVNKASLLQKIVGLREEKKEILGGISEIVDESDRNGIRAVIRMRKDANSDEIVNLLLKYTDLQMTFGINMVAIADGRPQQLGLIKMLKYYIDYQQEIVKRRTSFDLKAAKARLHIVEGLIIAIQNIDEVIRIIRKSRNTTVARTALMERFDLDTVQAQAILDMRLARLTSLEIEKLELECKELIALIKELAEILKSGKRQLEIVKDEMLEIKKKYKSPRLTSIVKSLDDINLEVLDDSIPFRENYVVYDGAGIKAVSVASFAATKKSKTSILPQDLDILTIKANNAQDVFAFTDQGNLIRFNINQLQECAMKDKSVPLQRFCAEANENEKIISFFCHNNGEEFKGALYVFTRNGMVKKTDYAEYDIGKPYYQAAVLKEGDSVVGAEIAAEDKNIVFVTEQGMCLNATTEDIPTQGRRSGGVKGVMMNDGDRLLLVTQVSDAGEILIVTEKGYAKRIIISEIDPMKRYRKGIKIIEFGAFNGEKLIFAAYVTIPCKTAFIHNEMSVTVIGSEDIKIERRTTKGRPLPFGKNMEIKAVKESIW